MATAKAWYIHNDILITLTGLQSSTMGTGSYLNNSPNVTVSVWKSQTTQSSTNRVLNTFAMTYNPGTNGIYRYVAPTTAVPSLQTAALNGMAIISVNHLGLRGEWRVPFQTQYRQTS